MKIKKLFEFRNIISLTAAGIGIYICLRYAAECTQGVKKGILFCIEVLVPSLYLFIALSSYLVRSGIVHTLTKPLGRISRLLFRLPADSLSAVLLCILGGYPVGGRCAEMLYEQGYMSEKEAQKTAYIAVCAGPGFLINYAGTALLNNRRAGYILLISQITGLLITGVIVGRTTICSDKNDETLKSSPIGREVSKRSKGRAARGKNARVLIDSVTDASRATFHMCGMVVVCAAMTEVISAVSPSAALTDIVSAVVEITTGCHRMCGKYSLYLIAFFIGFGGISVHLQIFAGFGRLSLNKTSFFLFRFIQGIITAAAAYTYLMIFPVKQSVFNSTDAALTLSKSATLAGSAALILCSLCFLGSVRQKVIKSKIQ